MEHDPNYDEYFETCDLCHDYFDLFQMRITEHNYLYCDLCLSEYDGISEKLPKISDDIGKTITE